MNKAQLYHRSNECQRVDTQLVLDEYLPVIKWNKHAKVMDVGCGTGDVTIDLLFPVLPKTFIELIGTDISEAMIYFAKKSYKNLEKVSFETMDISECIDTYSNFHENFDHITSFFCLHWVQNQR